MVYVLLENSKVIGSKLIFLQVILRLIMKRCVCVCACVRACVCVLEFETHLIYSYRFAVSMATGRVTTLTRHLSGWTSLI